MFAPDIDWFPMNNQFPINFSHSTLQRSLGCAGSIKKYVLRMSNAYYFPVFISFFVLTAISSPVFGFDHQHGIFNEFLQKNVVIKNRKSLVDYDRIQNNPKALQQYLKSIESVGFDEYKSWNNPEKIAFLVNAYNALTIQLILSKYPNLKSIKDLGGFFSSPWKKKFFTLFGKRTSLDFIEHGILRKEFNEPRIHFALVCASIGCPPLRNEAFTSEKLETQLNDAVQNFLQDPDNNRYDQKEKILYLSSVFNWFPEDFEKVAGSIEAFVAPWITSDQAEQKEILSGKVTIKYVDWDWSLNKAE